MQLAIPLLEGSEQVVEIPDEDGPEAAALIDAAAHAICQEYQRLKGKVDRQPGSESQKRERLDNWSRPVCYRLISHCLDQRLFAHLYKRVKEFKRYQRGEAGESNHFQKGLMSIFAEDKGVFDDRDRSRHGLSLWYAYRHYIPWFLVNGFALQVGPLKKEQAEKGTEANFAGWIAERRVHDQRTDLRKNYPPEVGKLVRQYKKEMGSFIGLIAGTEVSDYTL